MNHNQYFGCFLDIYLIKDYNKRMKKYAKYCHNRYQKDNNIDLKKFYANAENVFVKRSSDTNKTGV